LFEMGILTGVLVLHACVVGRHVGSRADHSGAAEKRLTRADTLTAAAQALRHKKDLGVRVYSIACNTSGTHWYTRYIVRSVFEL
jgi:hypothetical protein